MATGDTKKTSQLGITTTLQVNDRVVVLTNPATSPQTQTITLNNFTRSVVSSGAFPTANTSQKGVVRIGEGIDVTTDGVISNAYLPSGTYVVTTVTDTLYYVSSTDTVIFADSGAQDHDISIVLPIGGAIEGRQILIKNINPGVNRKVRITTTTGIQDGTALLEDPVKGTLVAYYDIITRGEGESFVHDGDYWRHTGTIRANPIFYWRANTYHQIVAQNASDGMNASGDLVVYNNLGNYTEGTGPFIDMGMDSSTFSNSLYTVFGPNDGYVYTGSARLLLGTDSEKDIVFFTGGTQSENKVLTINTTAVTSKLSIVPTSNNTFNIGSSTKYWSNVYSNNITVANNITSNNITTYSINGFSFSGTANNALFLGDIPASDYAYVNSIPTITTGIFPQHYQNTSFTIGISDTGKHILTQNSETGSQTITLPNNQVANFTKGSSFEAVVQSSGTISVANGPGVTMYLAGNSTAKSIISLNSFSRSSFLKIGDNTWMINTSGTGGTGGTADTGDITFSGIQIRGNGDGSLLGSIELVPNQSVHSSGQYVKIRPTVAFDETHIHMEAGNTVLADLFLGNDDRYVKIDHLGPVVVGVPGLTTTEVVTADNSQTGGTSYTFDLVAFPWAKDLTIGDTITFASQVTLTIDNVTTYGNQLTVIFQPATWVEGSELHFSYQPRKQWAFTPEGNITVPIFSEISTVAGADGKYSATQTSSDEIAVYSQRTLDGSNTVYAVLYNSVANTDAPYTAIEIRTDSGDTKDWIFDANGSVTLPGALVGNTVSAMWNEETPYQLNVHATINKIAPQSSNGPDQYYLADGVEGQIMYIVAGGTLNSEYTTMKFAHARYRDGTSSIVQGANVQWWLPFGGNLSGTSVLMYNTQVILTFTDGHWNLPHSIFD